MNGFSDLFITYETVNNYEEKMVNKLKVKCAFKLMYQEGEIT